MNHEFRVGLISFVGLLMMAVVVVYFYAFDNLSMYSLSVEFDNIRGMQAGDKVYFSGIKSGKITHLEYSGAKIYAQLAIDSKLLLPAHPVFQVETMGLMGENFIGVNPGIPQEQKKPSRYSMEIPGTNSQLTLEQTVELSLASQKIQAKVKSLPRFRSMKKGRFSSQEIIVTIIVLEFNSDIEIKVPQNVEWNKKECIILAPHFQGKSSSSTNDLISKGEDLVEGLKGTVEKFNSFLGKTDRIIGKIDQSLQGITLENLVAKSVKNLQAILSNMENASANISRLSYDIGGMTNEVNSMLFNFQALSGDLRREAGKIAGNLSDITDNFKLKNREISNLIDNLEKFSAQITATASKSTPHVENTLKNVDQVVGEVKTMIEAISNNGESAIKIKSTIDDFSQASKDISAITQDSRDIFKQSDLKGTAQKVAEISETVTEIIDGIKGVSGQAKLSVRYNQNKREMRSDVTADFYTQNHSKLYRVGVEGLGREDLLNLQMGYINGKTTARFGVLDSKLGVGLDYQILPNLTLGLELKDVEDTVIDAIGEYQINEYGFYFKGRDIGNKMEDSSLDVGLYRILE